MKVARTELVDLCRKVFEGMGFPLGDYEDCAEVITWLEMHGIPILNEIQHYRPAWNLAKSQATTILFEDESTVVIDAQDNGGLIYGSLALDLAYLKARQHGFAWLTLKQARHRRLLIPSLVKCAQRGMNGLIFWHKEGQTHVATIEAQQAYPCYTVYENPQPPKGAVHSQSLSILCSRNFAVTQHATASLPVESPLLCLRPHNFATYYQQHNESGMEIDTTVWAKLVVLSKHVLVESTELSRQRGAGEIVPQ